MIDLEKLNVNAIVRHYMLANTPRYLYRNLRADPTVVSLAEESNPKELLSAITAYEEKIERTPKDIAIAYAMLVALGFQDYGEVKKALVDWQPKALTWARHILSLDEPTIVTSVVNLRSPNQGHVGVNAEINDTPITTMEVL